MANERLGAQEEVVFHIQEGSFYNCVMPGKTKLFLVNRKILEGKGGK